MTALRDLYLVGRFEVLRALRTWRALALFLLYAIAYGGAAYIFVGLIGLMENAVAKTLGVATTDTPGAMMDTLIASDNFKEGVLGVTGNPRLVEELTNIPALAIFAMWLGLLLIPFFAASASAECISIDLRSRALRFEALRTGRIELVFGRFLGQLALTAMASFIAVLVTWSVGMIFMVGNHPVWLMTSLLLMTTKAWTFSVPFAGLGTAASVFTASPAWARVLAIGGTAGSWVLYGLARYLEGGRFWLVADLMLQLLPQAWIQTLWEPGLSWLMPAGVCITLGFAAVTLSLVRFTTRDL